jgi:conserved hypothetical protein TIGR00251
VIDWVRRTADGWDLEIRVQPGARRSEVVGVLGTALKVRVASPANDGKANAALVRFIADQLGVPTRAVEIVRGLHSRSKVVRVVGECDPNALIA